MNTDNFNYADERFADIQMLRYRLDNFEELSLRQKLFIYCLSKATLAGRDITFDQFGRYNLRIRKTLEAIYVNSKQRDSADFKTLEEYLKRVWFSNGIYHHYGCGKFKPSFSEDFFRMEVSALDIRLLPLDDGEDVEALLNELCPVIFQADVLPMRVNKSSGVDVVKASACNYYQDVSQKEVADYYSSLKTGTDEEPSWGLNSKLIKEDGKLKELVWKENGLYGNAIKTITYWLEKAADYADTDEQHNVINKLIAYYRSGNLRDFDDYSIAWVEQKMEKVDFINGFIEVYGDPMALKGSWEGIVEYKDEEASRRTSIISEHAQWFEDHSPVDPRFRKPVVKGVTANAVCAAMLGGDEYPSTAIGINLPNADWIRAKHGSKSITISNLTHAYSCAARGNGFREEFVIDDDTRKLIDDYDDVCDDLHTDLHECLGHGSGRLLPGVDPDALGSYGNTIEEARADLFGLYYMADEQMVTLGLLPNKEAYKAQYYSYIMNGLLTQLARINPGEKIEEAHMQNRALISRWALCMGRDRKVVELVKNSVGKTFVRINSYEALRQIFASELAEIQRIKSEGDYARAKELVETYGVNIDASLHNEIRTRYAHLNIAPYKGFINPCLSLVKDQEGRVVDVSVDYSEGYAHQMLRYSKEYGLL